MSACIVDRCMYMILTMSSSVYWDGSGSTCDAGDAAVFSLADSIQHLLRPVHATLRVVFLPARLLYR